MRKRLLTGAKLAGLAAAAAMLLSGCSGNLIVLDPQGPTGRTELHLIELSAILCAIVVIPVLLLLVYIVIRYRDKPGNTAPYRPDWADNRLLEIIWWGIPIVIIGILGTFTVKTTYSLMKPPVENATPVTIEVTSLDWKWLFQYPGEKVATVNYAVIPTGVPIQFILTSDAPMNSFWVPQLGGQEYTMPGMKMRLWLQADKAGKYFGSGANFTGKGFAHMQFEVKAMPQADYLKWVAQAKHSNNPLTMAGYNQLKQPGTSGQITYSSFPGSLFSDVVNEDGGIYMQNMNKMGEMSGSHSSAGTATGSAAGPAGNSATNSSMSTTMGKGAQ